MNINQTMASAGSKPQQQEVDSDMKGNQQNEDPNAQYTEGTEEATPEEQEDYEKVVLAGLNALNDPQINESVMSMISDDQPGEPAEKIAEATVYLVAGLDEQSGGTIPETVLLPASAEILENIAQEASDNGVASIDENVVGKAGQFMLIKMAELYDLDMEDMYGVMNGTSVADVKDDVEQQEKYAYFGVDANTKPQQQPAQSQENKMPSIINQVLSQGV